MAQLTLLDADKARIYGVPVEDTTTEVVLDQLVGRGWPRADAERHLGFALAAGVYVEAAAAPAKENPRRPSAITPIPDPEKED